MNDIGNKTPSPDDSKAVSSKADDMPFTALTGDGAISHANDPANKTATLLPETIQATLTWLNSFMPWGTTETTKQTKPEISSSTVSPQMTEWFAQEVASSQPSSETNVSPEDHPPIELDLIRSDPEEFAIVAPNGAAQPFLSQLTSVSSTAIDNVHSCVANALIAGIRTVSSERDRDEIIRWFIGAREILEQDASTTQKATALYQSTNSVRLAQLLTNTIGTSVNNYYGANLPLALKVAIPVTLVGAGYFGMQGAGLLAFGTGIGLPVVLLLFLGTAGATTVVEAFVKDRHVRDPLTKLLLMFVAFETARRAKKELLDALRADAMVPERAPVPNDTEDVLTFLMQMDPIAFERHVMSFFEQDGHPTGLTARSNDFGVDGYVFHPDGVIVVQCKRYGAENSVGRPAIQQFKGVIEEQRAFKGYFVTTSRFTAEAVESASKSSRITLVNGEEIVRWHREGRMLS